MAKVEPDTVSARELSLCAVNDGELYRSRICPVIENLARKMAAGKFDASKAPTLWRYVADDAAQRYTKDFGGSGNGSFGAFDPPTRQLAALEIADHYQEQLDERAAELIAERANRKRWTLAAIKAANASGGHFFFSRDTMRFFGDTSKSFRPKYIGHGVYLERLTPIRRAGEAGAADASSVGKLYTFNTETGDVRGVSEQLA